MTKLDWTKAGIGSYDPGRVCSVGDYGILSDRLAGRKGDVKVRRKKAKKKKANTAISVNIAPKAKSISPPNTSKPNKRPGRADKKPTERKPQGGLTIPEMVTRAKIKVDRLAADIQRQERKLATLREQLKSAERQLQVAKDTPRRSAIGKALQDAQRDTAS